jgi:hypothetical protein
VGRPRFWRALHFSTAFPVGFELSYHMGSVADRNGSVQMLVNRHRAAGQSMAKARLVDLPRPRGNGHGVIFGHHSLGLHREDPVQIASAGTSKRRAFFLRRDAEPGVELPDVPVAQKRVGTFHGRDPRQS